MTVKMKLKPPLYCKVPSKSMCRWENVAEGWGLATAAVVCGDESWPAGSGGRLVTRQWYHWRACAGFAAELVRVRRLFSFSTKHRVKYTCEPCGHSSCEIYTRHCQGCETNRNQGEQEGDQAKGITLIESTQIRWFSRWSGRGGRAEAQRRPRVSKLRAKGLFNYHSNEIVVEAVRWGASGPNKRATLTTCLLKKESWKREKGSPPEKKHQG